MAIRKISLFLLILGGFLVLLSTSNTAISQKAINAPPNEGMVLLIDTTSADQSHPAIAYSSQHDQFLVVYEDNANNGDIYGRFVQAGSGQKPGLRFPIADTSAREMHPDVVYDPFYDRFLVVFEYGDIGNRDINAILVYGQHQSSGSQLPNSTPTMVAAGIDDEYSPAVAYNADNHQFEVAFVEGGDAIKASNLDADASIPQVNVTNLVKTTAEGSFHHPDIAWGSQGQTFLVVWINDHPTFGKTVVVRYLKDTYPYDGSPFIDAYAHIISPADKNCQAPAITYDPLWDEYIIVYQQAENGGNVVMGVRYQSDEALSIGAPLVIETTLSSTLDTHSQPAITFCGAGGMSRIVYVSHDLGPNPKNMLFTRVISAGNVGERRMVFETWYSSAVAEPAIAGGALGRTLTAWSEQMDSEDPDLYARRAVPFWSFIPLVCK